MPPKKPAAKTAPRSVAAKPAASTKQGTGKKPNAVQKGSKKPAAPDKSKASTSKQSTPAKPAEKKWTKEDDAARIIQTQVRKYLAKAQLEKKKKEKKEYDELMDRLENEAFLHLVKMEQEQAERERLKEEEERKRKRELIKRRKRMLEAAFDGDIDEIKNILSEVKGIDDKAGVTTDVIGQALRNKNLLQMVECEDANDNTALSEAASGGHVDAVKLLISLGGNPNTKGQFGRSPLYRAAFAGHLDVVQSLLENGADLRIYADDGQTPQQVATLAPVKEVLSEWDVSQTEVLLAKLEKARESRAEEDRKRREAETSNLEDQLAAAKKEYEIHQKKTLKATEELNKRIYEHDSAGVEGMIKPDITLQAIHDSEMELEVCKMNLEKARDKLSQANQELRLQVADNAEQMGNELPGMRVLVRELDDVLLRDVGDAILNTGKWPLIVDPSAQAATFLRYRDTNYLNALSPSQMEPEKVRFALLGSIRYGKPLVLDMMEVDMFETVTRRFDEIADGLMSWIMDKTIVTEERYLKLLRATDPSDYHKTNFNEYRTSRFKFFIVTKNPFPPEPLIDITCIIRVFIPT